MSLQIPSEPYRAPSSPKRIQQPNITRSSIIGWWCVANMLLTAVVYCVLIVYPSYASGLYLASNREIWANSWDVPFYGGFWSFQFHVVGLIALITIIMSRFVVTPMALIVLVLAYRVRRNLGWGGIIIWVLVALIVPSTYWLTQSFEDRLFVWYFD